MQSVSSDTNVIDRLRQALANQDLLTIQEICRHEHPAEVANFLEGSTTDTIASFWTTIEPNAQGKILAHLGSPVRKHVLDLMNTSDIAVAIQKIDSDDATDILQDLSLWIKQGVLLSMSEIQRKQLAQLLKYSEDTAGGLMSHEVLHVRTDVTAEAVLHHLRTRGALPENTHNLIVTDTDNTYLGILSLADLVICTPKSKVADHYQRKPGVPANMAVEEVISLFEKYDLISAAVVNDEGALLGQITVDDVLDVAREKADKKILGMVGVGEAELFSPVALSALRRGVWLGINLVTAFIASAVIGLFQETIHAMAALAVLMPLVASMGGIAGTQTLTIVVRGLALGHLSDSNLRAMLRKECLVGLLNGTIWALVVSFISFLWFRSIGISTILGVAMLINHLVAASAGVLVPMMLKAVKIDPAIAGGVMLTTFTDVAGFFVFLGLATMLLLGQ